MNQKVLQKLLKAETKEEVLIEHLTRPAPAAKKKRPQAPGRPKLDPKLKAKNFTLCLAPEYLRFLDNMVIKDRKAQGRGRKIRFIIERFIEHEKRTLSQMKVLKEALAQVSQTVGQFGGRVKKGQKLELSAREKSDIGKAVDRVHLLMRVLNYSPKTLHRMLPKEEWAVAAFCMSWKTNRGVVV